MFLDFTPNHKQPKRIVFKIGSALLANEKGEISDHNLNRFISFFSQLRKEGREVILVTSGAVASADLDLNKDRKRFTLVDKQGLASIGQVNLMERYRKIFDVYQLKIAQILISKYSINHRPSYLNAQNTINKLLSWGVVPIINENDPLATEEIRFGENDILGALTSGLVESDLYVILSNIDGFYLYYGQKKQQKLDQIEKLEDFHWEAAKKGKSSLGNGGMLSKLEAAQVCNKFNIPVLITSGLEEDLYQSIFEKGNGTWFGARLNTVAFKSKEKDWEKSTENEFEKTKKIKKINTHKKWLLSHVEPKGEIFIDDGAEKALMEGKSLLPMGIKAIKGTFAKGDVCNIFNSDQIIARGMINYSDYDLAKIKGKKLDEIKHVLEFATNKEVIHCNHIVLI